MQSAKLQFKMKGQNQQLTKEYFILDFSLLLMFGISTIYTFITLSTNVYPFTGGSSKYQSSLIVAGIIWVLLIIGNWFKNKSLSSSLIQILKNKRERGDRFFILLFIVLPTFLGCLANFIKVMIAFLT